VKAPERLTRQCGCDWNDPPLSGSAHAPQWEARWGMTVEERLTMDLPDPIDDELDEEVRRLLTG
jgi:hypothetical protein